MDTLRAAAKADPRDWLSLESIANKSIERVRLTGDYHDYAVADEALNQSFKVAPPGTGPIWVRANLDFTLHRIAQAATGLDAVEKQALVPYGQKVGAQTMRARIAYFQGRYKDSLKLLDAMKPSDITSGELVARAEVLWHTGRVEEARKVLTAALEAKGASKAYIELAFGLLELDLGRYEEARKHYESALTLAPGTWLFEEHLAEILGKLGKLEEAETRYLDLIRRTENPEFMDALAEVYDKQKKPERAAELRKQSGPLFEERVKLFPEASAAHALPHYFVTDPARTVALAETNQKARALGESGVLLAKAYLVNNRGADAKRAIEAVLATEWNTPELHAVAAKVFEKVGDVRAKAEKAKAVAANPHVFDE
jgi:tetratricopeptide (TPR) repeat protein